MYAGSKGRKFYLFVDLAMSDHERLPSNFKERGDFEAVR